MNIVAPIHRYCQQNPNKTCPRQAWLYVQSLHQGYEARCWEPRCCYQGSANWSHKHGLILTRLADYIPENRKIYHGNLTMPEDASPENHIRTRREFLRILDRWKCKHNYTLELHGVLEISNKTNAHWDTRAYSDAPKKPLRLAVSEAWSRAGGLRQSLVPLDRDDPERLRCVDKYLSGDTLAKQAGKLLPDSQANMGMDLQWSTRGFWIKSQKDLWSEWITEWHGSKSERVGSRLTIDTDIRTNFRSKIVSKFRQLTVLADDYLREFSWFSLKDYPHNERKA